MGAGDGAGPVVLGLDFGGTKIAAAVVDAQGLRLGEATVPIDRDAGARSNLERGLDEADRLVRQVAADRRLAAVGAATFGIPTDEGIHLAPAIDGWEGLLLRQHLGEAFPGAIVRVANDVKAAAAAESTWGALAGCDPGVYLNLGTGLAVAIVAGGRVLSGAHGAAGEIAYNLRLLEDVGRGQDERVLLEDIVSGRALAARAGGDGAPLHDEFLTELGFHLVNLAVALDPQRIVVGGGMVRSWSEVEGPLRRALVAGVPFPPELMLAAFPFDASLVGAISLALDSLRGGPGAVAGNMIGDLKVPSATGEWGRE